MNSAFKAAFIELMASVDIGNRQTVKILAAPDKHPEYPRFRSRLQAKMSHQLNKFNKDGDIGKLSLDWKHSLDDAYAEAYQLGANAKQLSRSEKSWLNDIRAEQFDYLDGFLSDLDAGKGIMAADRRLGLYMKKVDAMYWSGAVKGLDEDVEMDWNLGNTIQSCEDCIDYQANSPYKPGELDTVPGAGDTDCSVGCDCTLTTR